MSSNRLNKVFVYGTLKRGEPNHHWLTSPSNGISKFIATGRTTDKFPLLIGTRYNIPLLLSKKGTGHRIHREIYEIDEEMFGKLDELEKYPQIYDREIQDIMTENGEAIPCWMYLIREYSESLLSENFLTSYKNTEQHPYCERYVAEM